MTKSVPPPAQRLCSKPGINSHATRDMPLPPRNNARQRRRKPESLPEDIPRASHPPQFHCQLPVALAAIQPLVWLRFSLLDFSAQEPLLLKTPSGLQRSYVQRTVTSPLRILFSELSKRRSCSSAMQSCFSNLRVGFLGDSAAPSRILTPS